MLCDVVRTMFSKRFVSELLKPQWMYKDKSIRQIFDKLAHSSIMKLNETSMSKLYSLMVMGVKYQLLRCASPQRFLDVTLTHLSELRGMCDTRLTDELLDECVDHCARTSRAGAANQRVIRRHSKSMSCVDARVEMLARHKGRPRRLEIDRGALSEVGRRRSSLPRYGRFTFGDWILCKQQLVQFFQGRKVRVFRANAPPPEKKPRRD